MTHGSDHASKPLDHMLRPFQRFARLEASGGFLLLGCTVAALIVANSALGHWYEDFFHHTEIGVAIGHWVHIDHHLVHWINDALMAVFFLLVGLELKREIVVGELASPKRAAVPIVAAIGGMVVPASIFALINMGGDGMRGWGIPMATDIAFAMGMLALLGRRIPLGLRVFLVSLAIVDDLGALMVIALFYTESLNFGALGAAGLLVGGLIVLNRLGARSALWYLIVGVGLWYAMMLSGVHATLAGVLVAMCVPARAKFNEDAFVANAEEALRDFDAASGHSDSATAKGRRQEALHHLELACREVEAPLNRLEHRLHPWVAFLIIPLFAFANAGVVLAGDIGAMLASPVTLGIALGLLLGKPLGIFGASYLAVKTGLGTLPHGVTWLHVLGVSFLGGIGFTMSLFVGNLSYSDAAMLNAAKLGVLCGSMFATIGGLVLLVMAVRRADANEPGASSEVEVKAQADSDEHPRRVA